MSQETQNIVNIFLKKNFSVRRIKNKINRWEKALIVPSDYIDHKRKVYHWNRAVNINIVEKELTEIVMKVFGYSHERSEKEVKNFLEKFKI